TIPGHRAASCGERSFSSPLCSSCPLWFIPSLLADLAFLGVLAVNVSSGRDCDHAGRAAGAAGDLLRGGADAGAGRRELVEVAEAGQPELAVAVHGGVVRERRIELARLAGVGADRLDADAEDVALLRQQLGALFREARRVRAVGADVQEGVALA